MAKSKRVVQIEMHIQMNMVAIGSGPGRVNSLACISGLTGMIHTRGKFGGTHRHITSPWPLGLKNS